MGYRLIIFFRNCWPRLIICIDLFVIFLMGEEVADGFSPQKRYQFLKKKNFMTLDDIITSNYTVHLYNLCF